MVVDILVLLAVVMAILKGYQQGLIMALFNTLSLWIGLAAAVKLSSVVAPSLAPYIPAGPRYLPIVSFILVFLVVLIIIRFAGKVLQKTLEAAKIGFINRLAGVVLYLLLYLGIISVLLFYIKNMGLLNEAIAEKSTTYSFIAPYGPAVLNATGFIIPWFKDMFAELNLFFEGLSDEVTPIKSTELPK
ncbi:MAG: CvpA family protein [Chitinophagaceae bacterium]|nr:CvpA family protein [Chitinophagaceae bacterium]